jgi:thiol:disulfide interchange protein
MRPVLLLVLAVTAVAGFQNFSFQSQGVGVDWQMYSDQRLREAAGRPVLVEFTADWCINCKTLERTTFRDRQLLEVIDKLGITTLRVDLTQGDDARRQVFDRFGGRAIPYILILDKQGQLVQRFTGMVAADTLIDSIKAMES